MDLKYTQERCKFDVDKKGGEWTYMSPKMLGALSAASFGVCIVAFAFILKKVWRTDEPVEIVDGHL